MRKVQVIERNGGSLVESISLIYANVKLKQTGHQVAGLLEFIFAFISCLGSDANPAASTA